MTSVQSTGRARDRLVSTKSGEATPARGATSLPVMLQRGSTVPDTFAMATGVKKASGAMPSSERQALGTELRRPTTIPRTS